METPLNHDRPYYVISTSSPSPTRPDRKRHFLCGINGTHVSTTTGGNGQLAYQERDMCNDAYEAGIAEGARRAAAGQQNAP